MKYIRLVVISVVFLSLLITGISLLFPSKVIASRAVEVISSSEKIAYFTSDLSHWNQWMSDWKQNKVVLKNNTAYIGTQTVRFLDKSLQRKLL